MPENFSLSEKELIISQTQSQWQNVSSTPLDLEQATIAIQGIGYDRICQDLQAKECDRWQEYTLLQIESEVDVEPIHLLKMTCPSTGFIHVLRVPPDISSAREAICWVNWGIDPTEFAIQS
jgi:hypothetical protein